MKQLFDLVLSPEIGYNAENLQNYLIQHKKVSPAAIISVERRSIDARSKNVKINVRVAVYTSTEDLPALPVFTYPNVSQKPSVIVVGAGPAGLFAALRLIELGLKPIVLERGKDVQARRRDLAALNKEHIVHQDSNYCFGEGGAGTYSDGKLYTRSTKRGDIRRILEILVAHGAKEEILVEAHPHIGTNKLPKIVENLRNSIIRAGGEVYFEHKVTDFISKQEKISGVITKNKAGELQEHIGLGVILATGHSARDIFELLHQKEILIYPKPFALGVRIEHPQALIDKIQYHCEYRGAYLPPAAYSLVEQTKYEGKEKGVFSFCMCPGGFIVPSATAQGEVVVNGMSPSRRDGKFANSGIVVAVDEDDWQDYQRYGALAALAFQKDIEKIACELAGNTQTAPAQKMLDFVEKKYSQSLLPTSYQPGIYSVELRDVLPKQIAYRLQEGLKAFGKKMKGYLTNEAQLIGVESRTSSPVSIPRHKETYEHLTIQGLFPCGEGAGYAGGIMSAAIDGERCAEKLVNLYHKH